MIKTAEIAALCKPGLSFIPVDPKLMKQLDNWKKATEVEHAKLTKEGYYDLVRVKARKKLGECWIEKIYRKLGGTSLRQMKKEMKHKRLVNKADK